MSSAQWGTPTYDDDGRPNVSPKQQARIHRARTITLSELFRLPPTERYAMIDLIMQVRDPDEGWLLRVNPDREPKVAGGSIPYQLGPQRPRRTITTTRTRVGTRAGIYLFGKYGDYPELAAKAPDRHACIVEYVQQPDPEPAASEPGQGEE